MSGFKGQAEYSIDGKGRVPVPAKMRRSLSPEANESFVATRGFETCIMLHPSNRWGEITDKLDELNEFDPESRLLTREMNRWAEDLTLDGQGRVALPKMLLDYAGVASGEKALIIGAGRHIEIWNPAEFDAYLNSQTVSYSERARTVMAAARG